MKPIVAIVGRPNVGKSTLFNRLVRRRLAIVHDEPGVTRDRHYADANLAGREVTLVDTGGFDPGGDDPMKQGIKRQIDAAIAEADVIVCVLDSREPATSIDHAEMKLLRQAQRPTVFVANKADSEKGELEAAELYRLGIDRLICVSALHGRRMSELEAAIGKALPPEVESDEPDENAFDIDALDAEEPPEEDGAGKRPARPNRMMRIAIIGKPNAGKSSLTNRLAGEERMLVDDRPGTTRDSVDVVIERRGREYLLVDTAGIRRKAKVKKEHSQVEVESVLSAIRAMERADVVVLLADARDGVAEQDAKILGLAVDRGRGIVVGLNKVDLMDKQEAKRAETDARDKLSFATYAEVCLLSAKTGRGTDGLIGTVSKVGESFKKRVGTGELNRFFEQVLKTHPPPTRGGRAPRLYFITQVAVCPPTFVVSTSDPDKLHFSYQRYVQNQIRQAFDFVGVPLVVHYRKRRRRGDEPTGEKAPAKRGPAFKGAVTTKPPQKPAPKKGAPKQGAQRVEEQEDFPRRAAAPKRAPRTGAPAKGGAKRGAAPTRGGKPGAAPTRGGKAAGKKAPPKSGGRSTARTKTR